MLSFSTKRGYTSKKLQEIADNLPPYVILAILEFPCTSQQYKSNLRFSQYIENASNSLDQHPEGIEQFLTKDPPDPDAKRLWALLFARDIDVQGFLEHDKNTYLINFCRKITENLRSLGITYTNLFSSELNQMDFSNVDRILGLFYWGNSEMADDDKAILANIILRLAHNEQTGDDKDIPLVRMANIQHEAAFYMPLLQAMISVQSLDINKTTNGKSSPLSYAVYCANGNKCTQFVKLLLLARANARQIDSIGRTILFDFGGVYRRHVLTQEEIEVARLLIDAGVDINHKDNYGNTAVGHAAESGKADVIAALLTFRPDVENVNEKGNTPLITAVKRLTNTYQDKYRQCVKVLLEYSCTGVNIQNNDGDTALLCAVRDLSRSKDDTGEDDHVRRIIELLIQYGADPGLKNKKGETAFTVEQSKGFNDVVRFQQNIADKRFAMLGGLGATAIGLGIGLALGLWEDLPEELEYPAWGISLIAIAPPVLFAAGLLCKGQSSTSNTSIFSRLKDLATSMRAGTWHGNRSR